VGRMCFLLLTLWIATGVDRAAQAQATIDTSLASRGQHVWNVKECGGCHAFGRQQSTGPDLVGVTDRRSLAWLRKWLKDPQAPDDRTSRTIRAQYDLQMPNMDLTDQEIDDLIALMAEQTRLHAKN